MRYIYALYSEKDKAFITSSGYYGNECYIKCFPDKEHGLRYLQGCGKGHGLKLKRMRVK